MSSFEVIARVQPGMSTAGTTTAAGDRTRSTADGRRSGEQDKPQTAALSREDSSLKHVGRVLVCGLASLPVVALLAYGFDYYRLGLVGRALSSKHHLLRPSGTVGMGLALAGMAMFLAVFAYPLRKRWSWLGRRGNTRSWLAAHVFFGFAAPVLLAFHSAFQFRGIAGMAFWIMAAVAISGVVGRYLYAQIPRSLSAAEMSFKDASEQQEELSAQLAAQTVLTAAELEPLFRMPSPEKVAQTNLLLALCSMIAVDLARPVHLARLRQRLLGFRHNVTNVGGLLRSHDAHLEAVVALVRRQGTLSKRILFLSRSQQLLHLWHVIHRPFSYSLIVLVVLHILVVTLFGVLLRFF